MPVARDDGIYYEDGKGKRGKRKRTFFFWRVKIMLSIIFNRGTKDIEDANYVFSPDHILNIIMKRSGSRTNW